MGIEINVPALFDQIVRRKAEWGGAAQTSPESGTSSNDKGTVSVVVLLARAPAQEDALIRHIEI